MTFSFEVGWTFLGSSALPIFSLNDVGHGARGLVMRGDRFGEIPWRGRAGVGTFNCHGITHGTLQPLVLAYAAGVWNLDYRLP